jgi:hypothetical protein
MLSRDEQSIGKRHLRRYALSIFLGVLCDGCIMYVPDALNRTARESRAVATLPSIIPGQTTEEEVLLALGEPDAYFGNQLFYSWRKFKFLLFLVGTSSAGGTKAYKNSRLVITVDEHGVVSEQKLEDDWDWSMIP